MEEKKYLVIDGKQTRIEDLTGRKVGRLTVIKFDKEKTEQFKNENNRSVIYWLCKCDCEREDLVSISASNLRSECTKSCGCISKDITYFKKDNLIGQKFGRLTVIELDVKKSNDFRDKNNRSKLFWLCKCDCGSEKVVSISTDSLKNGTTKSCGCLSDENKRNNGLNKIKKGISLSFYDWCLENNHKDYLELWDYKLNEKSPQEVACKSNKKYYFKCLKGLHESELKTLDKFTLKSYNLSCNKCNSLAQFGIDKYGDDFFNRYWSKNNKLSPWDISKSSKTKILINCINTNYHGEYETYATIFTKGCGCPYCSSLKVHPKDSFARYHIDNTDVNFLEKYWDYNKNKISPWELSVMSDKKIFIKCQQKSYHGSYEIATKQLSKGNRCGFCTARKGKVHEYDSLGYLFPDTLNIWSNKNKKSPFEYSPNSGFKVYWKCENEIHNEYFRSIDSSNKLNFRCPECSTSFGEQKISNYLSLNNIKYMPQKEFDNLLGISNGNLKFDFYLELNNIKYAIEYDGIQHYEPVDFEGLGIEHAKEKFEILKQHDKLKNKYCKNNKIKLIRIPYWDFDNIEEILIRELKLN